MSRAEQDWKAEQEEDARIAEQHKELDIFGVKTRTSTSELDVLGMQYRNARRLHPKLLRRAFSNLLPQVAEFQIYEDLVIGWVHGREKSGDQIAARLLADSDVLVSEIQRRLQESWDRRLARLNPSTEAPAPSGFDLNEAKKTNPYKKTIKGVEVDLYDIYAAYELDACVAHAVKKLMCLGKRSGGKSRIQDLKEAVWTLKRVIEIEEGTQ